jgi:hypothetical protein
MNQQFELELRRQLASDPGDLKPGDFAARVDRRIRHIRRMRLIARVLLSVVLLVVALAITPSVVNLAGHVAEYPARITSLLGQVATSPVAYMLGILTALYALLEQRSV